MLAHPEEDWSPEAWSSAYGIGWDGRATFLDDRELPADEFDNVFAFPDEGCEDVVATAVGGF